MANDDQRNPISSLVYEIRTGGPGRLGPLGLLGAGFKGADGRLILRRFQASAEQVGEVQQLARIVAD